MKKDGRALLFEARGEYKALVDRAWDMGQRKILDNFRISQTWGWRRISKIVVALRAALDEIDARKNADVRSHK